MRAEKKESRSKGWFHAGSVNIPLFTCVILSLVLLPFSYSCSPVDSERETNSQEVKGDNGGDDNKGGNKGGSSDWKDWNEWTWEKPELNEIVSRRESWGLRVEFVSVWGEKFSNYSTGSDGFLVFHFGSKSKLENVVFSILESGGMTILADTSVVLDSVPANSVTSMFVPIKAPGMTGEFKIETEAGPESAVDSDVGQYRVYVIKVSRRNIYGLTWSEYSKYKTDQRLSQATKREGSELYRPSDYGEPIGRAPEGAVIEPDSYFEGYFEILDTDLPPGEEDHPEWSMDVEIGEAHSYHYKFEGRITYCPLPDPVDCVLDPSELLGVFKARVWVFDDNSRDASFLGDYRICGAYTNESGYFRCEGDALDLFGYADPYIVVEPTNNSVKVKNCNYTPDRVMRGTYRDEDEMWELGGALYGFQDLPPSTDRYLLYHPPNVSDSEILHYSFNAFRWLNLGVARNLVAWQEIYPDRNNVGHHEACVPEDVVEPQYDLDWHEIDLAYNHAMSLWSVGHEFGHSLHDWLTEYRGLPGPRNYEWCSLGNNVQTSFREGFAGVMPHYMSNDPGAYADGSIVHFKYDRPDVHPLGPIEWAWENYTCTFEADGTIRSCTPPAELWSVGECSPAHNIEVYRAIRQVLCRWYPVGSAYCPSFYTFGDLGDWLMDWGDRARRGVSPNMIETALWDLYDNGYGGMDDGTCELHWWNHRRQACDTWYAYQDTRAWGVILDSMAIYRHPEFPHLKVYPLDYFQFIWRFYDVSEREAQARGEQFNECEVKNYLRTTSRFNGITLRGIFGDPDEWGLCDQWENTPGGAPPPCAATEAVVTAVEGGVEGVEITPEEGEALLERVRRIRDEYLLNSDRGQIYAYLYSAHSDEIIAGILGNPQITLIALELIEKAAYKVDNFENYLLSGIPPVDDEFIELVSAILDELKSHTSPDLINSISVVERDLVEVQGMTLQELLDYFGYAP